MISTETLRSIRRESAGVLDALRVGASSATATVRLPRGRALRVTFVAGGDDAPWTVCFPEDLAPCARCQRAVVARRAELDRGADPEELLRDAAMIVTACGCEIGTEQVR